MIHLLLVSDASVYSDFYIGILEEIRTTVRYRLLNNVEFMSLDNLSHYHGVIIATQMSKRRSCILKAFRERLPVLSEPLFASDFNHVMRLSVELNVGLKIAHTRLYDPNIKHFLSLLDLSKETFLKITSRFKHTNMFERVHQEVSIVCYMIGINTNKMRYLKIFTPAKHIQNRSKLNDIDKIMIVLEFEGLLVEITISSGLETKLDYRLESLNDNFDVIMENTLCPWENEQRMITYWNRFAAAGQAMIDTFIRMIMSPPVRIDENHYIFDRNVNNTMLSIENELKRTFTH